jgi:hypothetical protein
LHTFINRLERSYSPGVGGVSRPLTRVVAG